MPVYIINTYMYVHSHIYMYMLPHSHRGMYMCVCYVHTYIHTHSYLHVCTLIGMYSINPTGECKQMSHLSLGRLKGNDF